MIGRLMFGNRSTWSRSSATRPSTTTASDAIRMAMAFRRASIVIHMAQAGYWLVGGCQGPERLTSRRRNGTSVGGGSADAENCGRRPLRRSGGRAGGAGRGSRLPHRDQRSARARLVRRVQSARRRLLLPEIRLRVPEVRLRGAGLLLPGLLPLSGLLRAGRLRSEPAGSRVPVAAAVSGAGPAAAATRDRRRVPPRAL